MIPGLFEFFFFFFTSLAMVVHCSRDERLSFVLD